MKSISPTTLYFNAASHGIPESDVYDQMIRFTKCEAELGPIRAIQQSSEQLQQARNDAGKLLGTTAEMVGFASTTTAAWHVVVSQLKLQGKKVLIAPHEWGDYYRALSSFSTSSLEVLPPLDFEAPDLSAWSERIDESVAAIFVPMITSIAGYRYPIEEIGALPRPDGTRLVVDAAQALGQTKVDIRQLGCDAVVSTGRKWVRGPRQTALFCLSDDWSSELAIGRTRELEPADQSAAATIGLGAAINHLLDQTIELTESRLATLAKDLRTSASNIGLNIYGGTAARSAIVSLLLQKSCVPAIEEEFQKSGIVTKFVNSGKAEPRSRQPSVDQAILRISPHVYTSEHDLNKLISILSNNVAKADSSATK